MWCGSLGICQYLLDHNDSLDLSRKAVIELGSGTGVVGMTCSKLGAPLVILTDHDQRSLNHMTNDCKRNNIDAVVLPLDWFKDELDRIILEMDQRPAASSLPSLIVAGDVLYKKILLEPFFSTVERLFSRLGRRGVSMLLCHVPRADVNHVDIIDVCRSKRLAISEISPDEWRKGCCVELSPEDDFSRAKLYSIHQT